MKNIRSLTACLVSVVALSASVHAQVPVNANLGMTAEYNPLNFGAYWPVSAGTPVPAAAKGFFVVTISKTGGDIPANNYSISLSLPAGAAWTGEAFTLPTGYTLDATLSTNTSLYIMQTGAHTGSGIAAMKTFNVPVQATAPESPAGDNYMAQIVREGVGYTDNDPVNDEMSASVFVGGTNLSVTWLTFTASKSGKTSLLDWATASEKNNKGFEIERSADVKKWKSIGFLQSLAPDGNSNSRKNYSFSDNAPLAGINYYRLKQVDKDGKVAYSDVRTVSFEDGSSQITIFPNPTQGKVTLSGLKGTEHIQVYNSIGQLVLDRPKVQGTIESVDLTGFAAGFYNFLVLENSVVVKQYKLIKQQ